MRAEAEQAVVTLAAAGQAPHDIAVALGVPEREVEALTASRRQVSTVLSDDDKRLAEAMRDLAWQARDFAIQTFLFGHPREKAELTRAILGRTMGLVGLEQTQMVDEVRSEFEGMLRGMRGTDESIVEVPHAEVGAPPGDAYDPDEGRHH